MEAASIPQAEPTGDELLVVDNVRKYFPITRGIIFQKEIASVKAVDGVSFSIRPGETLGIVGESGCGKSTLARCIMRLLDTTDGRIVFEGRDVTHLSRMAMRPIRREMTMIFQDPYASLNPPSGCRFHPRCPYVMDKCVHEVPELAPAGSDADHLQACWLDDATKEREATKLLASFAEAS